MLMLSSVTMAIGHELNSLEVWWYQNGLVPSGPILDLSLAMRKKFLLLGFSKNSLSCLCVIRDARDNDAALVLKACSL